MTIVKEQKMKGPSAAGDDDPPPSYRRRESSSRPSTHRSTPSISVSPLRFPSDSSSPAQDVVASTETNQRLKRKPTLLDLLFGGKGPSARDVKNTVYKSIRDAVKNPCAEQSSTLIETSAEMCRAKGINFSNILQDPCIEKHRALYWVIISRPPPNKYSLITAILKHSERLSSDAIDEIRLACVQVGDQTLFDHFWRHPVYNALSTTDELILGGTVPTDSVEVQETMSEGIATFTARFKIAQFHRRMNVSGKVVFEFIARGRLWYLKFQSTSTKQGNTHWPWTISLSMANPSLQTWLNSRIVIVEVGRKPSAQLPPWPDSLTRPSEHGRGKCPIQILLQTKVRQLEPSIPTKAKGTRTEVVASFEDDPTSTELQYIDSPYYQDECLQMIMEARLEKPVVPQTCIIC